MAHESGYCHLWHSSSYMPAVLTSPKNRSEGRWTESTVCLFRKKSRTSQYFPTLHQPTFLKLTAKARSSSAAFSRMWPEQDCLAASFFRRSSHVFKSWKNTPFVKFTATCIGTDEIFLVSTLILNWPFQQPQDYNRATLQQHLGDGIVA